MKTFISTLLIISFFNLYGQERVNMNLPKVNSTIIGQLSSATGWILNPEGQWVSGKNTIPDYLPSKYQASINSVYKSQGTDNFISYQIRSLKIKERGYFILIKKFNDGYYNRQNEWIHKNSVYYYVFDSLQFSRINSVKPDTLSLIQIEVAFSGELKWPVNDFLEIEQDLARQMNMSSDFRTANINLWFHFRPYKAKNLIQFQIYSTEGYYPIINGVISQHRPNNESESIYLTPKVFDYCYYETGIENFKNLFGPDLHLKYSIAKNESAEKNVVNKIEKRELDTKENLIANNNSQNEAYVVPEQMPEFEGGAAAMMKFINSNTHYPASALRMGVEGQVYVQFVIDSDGKVNDVVVMKGVSVDCDKEAIRVIEMMPKWKPGMQSGKPVRTRYVLPVKFKI